MIDKKVLGDRLLQLEHGLHMILNDIDEEVIANMKSQGKDVSRFLLWEWKQGVGVYGLYKCYKTTGEKRFLTALTDWFDDRLQDGLPDKNVNTVAPMLTMACLYSETKDEKYLPHILEWAAWVMTEMPRTEEGGIQHSHSESDNEGELWDDTLFMTVLFLAKAGMILERKDYVEEAIFQFLLHIQYLRDNKTGLWYHGWTFNGRHNFADALWGRGNSWVTIAIPEFLEIVKVEGGVRKFLLNTLAVQVATLAEQQDISGMWHTLLMDRSSYLEASATAGFAFGILKGVRLGYLEKDYLATGKKALQAVIENISSQGELLQVSYGTNVGKTLEEYKNIPLRRMAYGQAMAMLAIIEGVNH